MKIKIKSLFTNKISLLHLMFFISVSVVFPQKIKVSGTITDSKTGEVLIGVFIVDKKANKNSVSNKFGYYSFNSDSTHLSLICSSIGYKLKSMEVNILSDTILNIQLDPVAYEIKEVTVYNKKLEDKIEAGKLNIPISIIQNIPSLMGEPDILKAYQLMPGVQVGNEANNGLYVRGGTPDQNLFLFDDIPLYNVNHLGGLFSVFDHSIIKNVDLYKGGFPARYGGRISSIIDIRTKDGNTQELGGELGLGLLTSKIFLDGPIKKNKSSFVASARYSNLGLYSYVLGKFQNNPNPQGYMFYDISLKGNFKISDYNKLSMSFFKGNDIIYYKQKEYTSSSSQISYSGFSNLKWGNTAGSIKWLHILKNGNFNNLTLSYTKYNYNSVIENTTQNTTQNTVNSDMFSIISSSNDVILKTDFEIPKDKINIKLGANIGFHSYVPTTANEKIQLNNNTQILEITKNNRINALDMYIYSEFEYKITNHLYANSGLRAGFYDVNSGFSPIIEPRLVVNYHFLPNFSLKPSYSRMNQQIHLLTNSGVGLPSDIWVPSTTKLKPESSDQISLTLTHSIKNKYEFTIDVYLKYLHNLIEYKDGTLLFDSSKSWEEKVENGGIGKVKGIEFLAQKKTGRLTGWIGYTLLSNIRQFKNINRGHAFPYVYEQKHNISIVGNYKLNEKWEITGNWIFHSGNHITLPSAKYISYWEFYNNHSTPEPVDIYIYSEKNGYKMPDYHRLDIGFFYTRKQTAKKSIKWSFNIYNVYNHQNAYYLYYKESSDGTLKLYQKTIFPFLFNIGCLITF